MGALGQRLGVVIMGDWNFVPDDAAELFRWKNEKLMGRTE
jgi:hypothetical protein